MNPLPAHCPKCERLIFWGQGTLSWRHLLEVRGERLWGQRHRCKK